jgi:hypothetical protein
MEAEEDSTGPLSQRIKANLQKIQEREKSICRFSMSMGVPSTISISPASPWFCLEELVQADIQMYKKQYASTGGPPELRRTAVPSFPAPAQPVI